MRHGHGAFDTLSRSTRSFPEQSNELMPHFVNRRGRRRKHFRGSALIHGMNLQENRPLAEEISRQMGARKTPRHRQALSASVIDQGSSGSPKRDPSFEDIAPR